MSPSPSLADANLRSPIYFVARTNARCPHCGASTRVLALALPPAHETLTLGEEAADEGAEAPADAWQPADADAFLFYVEQLTPEVGQRLRQLTSCFRPARSAATQTFYWANHCEHCGRMLEDHELHCEPDGAFLPSDGAAAAQIRLLQIRRPFEAAAAGYALHPQFFELMAKV